MYSILYFGTLLAFSVTALVPMHQDSREAAATSQKLEEKVMPNARQRWPEAGQSTVVFLESVDIWGITLAMDPVEWISWIFVCKIVMCCHPPGGCWLSNTTKGWVSWKKWWLKVGRYAHLLNPFRNSLSKDLSKGTHNSPIFEECQTQWAKVLTLPWKRAHQEDTPQPIGECQVDFPLLQIKDYPGLS